MTYNNNQSYDTPVAPLGLWRIGLLMSYTPIAPLGFAGRARCPTYGYWESTFTASHTTSNLGYIKGKIGIKR